MNEEYIEKLLELVRDLHKKASEPAACTDEMQNDISYLLGYVESLDSNRDK